MDSAATPITELLARWRGGDAEATNALMEAVYPLLRQLARARLRQGMPITLQATELANEAYARLDQSRAIDWQSRAHFFAVSAKIIRGLAVDHVRAQASEKRGGDLQFVSLELAAEDAAQEASTLDVLTVDQALNELERDDPVSARVVELKFFSGLTTEEIAAVCGISTATVVRHWRFARAWLADKLSSA